MWYRGADGANGRIGYAASQDGISWTKYHSNPILTLGNPGTWDDYSLLVSKVMRDGTNLRMWYAGSDGSNERVGTASASFSFSGYLESAVFDSGVAGAFWNSMNWTEFLPPNTNITISTRTGNSPVPDPLWSSWSAEMWDETGSTLTSPRGRFIQYRATLSTTDQNVTPILSEVHIDYTLNTAQPPALLLPLDGIWIVNNMPAFSWSFGDSEGDLQSGFTVQIDDDPLFMSIDYTSGNIDSSNPWWTPSSPIADGIWHWRVRTRDTGWLWSPYSNHWTIKIDSSPPTFANLSEIPDPQEIHDYVNISANVTDNVAVSQVWINITGIGSFPMDFDFIQKKYFYNSSFGSLGTYPYIIWSNDTTGNWGFISGSILIQDTTPPLISSLQEDPDPQEVDGNVNVSAEITDNFMMGEVWINIVGLGNFTMAYDSAGDRYFYNLSYSQPDTYGYSIWANDSNNNWASASSSFLIQDTEPPEISGLAEEPDPQYVNKNIRISAAITDNIEVDEVWIYIEGTGNFSMTFNSTSNRYSFELSHQDAGIHSYTIWAKDSSDNWNSESSSYTIIKSQVEYDFLKDWWWLILLLIIFLLIIIILLLQLGRRKRKEDDENAQQQQSAIQQPMQTASSQQEPPQVFEQSPGQEIPPPPPPPPPTSP
jgi:hypothetical protein